MSDQIDTKDRGKAVSDVKAENKILRFDTPSELSGFIMEGSAAGIQGHCNKGRAESRLYMQRLHKGEGWKVWRKKKSEYRYEYFLDLDDSPSYPGPHEWQPAKWLAETMGVSETSIRRDPHIKKKEAPKGKFGTTKFLYRYAKEETKDAALSPPGGSQDEPEIDRVERTDQTFTVAEVADLSGYHEFSVYRCIRKGQLHAEKKGGVYAVTLESLREWWNDKAWVDEPFPFPCSNTQEKSPAPGSGDAEKDKDKTPPQSRSDEQKEKLVFTDTEVADLFDITRSAIRRWCREGDLIASQMGRNYRISRHDLEAFWRQRTGGDGELFGGESTGRVNDDGQEDQGSSEEHAQSHSHKRTAFWVASTAALIVLIMALVLAVAQWSGVPA